MWSTDSILSTCRTDRHPQVTVKRNGLIKNKNSTPHYPPPPPVINFLIKPTVLRSNFYSSLFRLPKEEFVGQMSLSWWTLFHLCAFSVGQRRVSAGHLGGWRALEGKWTLGWSASAAWGRRTPCCPPWSGRWWLCPLYPHDPFDQCDECSLHRRTVNIKTMGTNTLISDDTKWKMWWWGRCPHGRFKLEGSTACSFDQASFL